MGPYGIFTVCSVTQEPLDRFISDLAQIPIGQIRPDVNFQIFGTEPQKNILDQKLTKNATFHILPHRTKTVQSNLL